jgi:hypothetical protein
MGADALVLRAELGLCLAVLMLGAVVALTSANLVKRVAGVLIAHVGAVLAASVLAGGTLLIVGVAAMGATLMIGVALIVRLQERYSGVEAAEQDVADADAEPRETTPQ